MKKIIAFLLALLILTGCSPNNAPVEQTPVASENPAVEIVEEPEEEQLDVPMTEEEAAAAEAAKAAELEERARTKSLPVGAFTAPTIDEGTLTESVFAEADLTVVNIWATYCAPCKEEMPILAKLHNELDGVQIVGLILDCTDETDNVIESQAILAKALMEDAGVTYENMLLNQDLMDCGFGAVSAVPATIFVDRDGNTVGQGFYGALDENGWREAIAERLEIAQARYE